VDGIVLDKAFPDSPIPPGGVVNLTFTLVNTSTTAEATQIGFSDDLDAALPGLTALGTLPIADVCGPGSQLSTGSGATRLTLTGGRLEAGATCTFAVTLRIPVSVAPETYLNRTSQVTAMLAGLELTSAPAEAGLDVMFLGFAKAFTDDPVIPDETVTLAFTLTNPNPVLPATELAFTDDLGAVMAGLEAMDLPRSGICGPGSHIAGTSTLTFTGGNLGPGESCTFAVSLRVPANAAAGTFTNISSGVTGQLGGRAVLGEAALAASDDLEILPSPVAVPGIGLWGLLLVGVVLQLSAALALRRAGA
jgi:hypothetical protein